MAHADDVRKVEQLTIRVHDLIRTGQGDSDTADEIREQLLEPWNRLPTAIRKLLDDLSGDLYMLVGREHLGQGSATDVLAIREAWSQKNWLRILELCRQNLPKVDEHGRAYVRARAYGQLGLPLAACSFFDHAARLKPDQVSYQYLAIESLLNAGESKEAWERIQRMISSEDTPPTLLLKAADVMYNVAISAKTGLDTALLERVISLVDQALSKDTDHRMLMSVRVSGLVKKGYALILLQRPAKADAVFTEALEIDAENDVVLVARGLLRLDQQQHKLAATDFEQAISLGTPLPWPYIFLVKSLLESGQADRGLDLVEKALLHVQSDKTRANLLELKGIALAYLGLKNDSLNVLWDADALSPLNSRIARNITTVKEGKPPTVLEVEIDTSPREALKTASGW